MPVADNALEETSEIANDQPPIANALGDTVFDLMVVYTQKAREMHGGTAALETKIANAVANANNAYINTDISMEANLVHMMEVKYYTETGSTGNSLDAVTSTSDGLIDEVHTWRNHYGADLVAFITEDDSGGSCSGIAWVMQTVSTSFAIYGFSATDATCLAYPVFTHELGHNQGSAHNIENASAYGAYDYSFGHRRCSNEGDVAPYFRTIMSYSNNCTDGGNNRINYFSNPNIYWDSAPTGVVNGVVGDSNNALSINNTKATVAALRSTVASPSPVPNNPSNLNSTTGSSSRIDLVWNDLSTDETSFTVERSDDGGTTWQFLVTQAANTTSYSDTGLTALTEYYYRVYASNNAGYSANTNEAFDTTDALGPPPNAPTNLNVSVISHVQLKMTWDDNASDELGFKIERSSNGGGFVEVASLSADSGSYSDTGLTPSTTYSYRVYAYNDNGASGFSNTANGQTLAPPPPDAAPTNLQANATSGSTVALSWNESASNEDGVKVARSEDQSNWSVIADLSANSTSYNDSGLDLGTLYYYRVYTYNAGGDSSYAIANATTDNFVTFEASSQSTAQGTVSGSLSNTHADDGSTQTITEIQSNGNPRRRRSYLDHTWIFNNVTPGFVTLNVNAWRNSGSLDDFEFSVSTDGGANFGAPLLTINNMGDNGLVTVNLPPATNGTVYIKVTDTDNSQGESVLDKIFVDQLFIKSESVAGNPPADPSALNALAIAYNQVDISWTDYASDELGFKIERSDNGAGFIEIDSIGANSTSYTDSSVSGNNAYQYRVLAFNAPGDSGYAVSNSVTTPVAPPAPDIALSADDYKVKGKHTVDLAWSGANGADVDIYRDAGVINTTNANVYTDNIGAKGGATYVFIKSVKQEQQQPVLTS